MKRITIILTCLLLVFLPLMVAWVDPNTVPVYTGTLSGNGLYSGYQVSFYVDQSFTLIRDSSGALYNNGSTVIHGAALINNLETALRFFPSQSSELEINGIWESYSIIPDQMPAKFPAVVYAALIIVFVLALVLVFSIVRGFGV